MGCNEMMTQLGEKVMDVFDQYFYDEITESHARANLSSEDYLDGVQKLIPKG